MVVLIMVVLIRADADEIRGVGGIAFALVMRFRRIRA
jgi:hypothetical protein